MSQAARRDLAFVRAALATGVLIRGEVGYSVAAVCDELERLMETNAVTKCEGCGATGAPQYVHVHLVNGGLTLCRPCLDQFNAKNPELLALRPVAGDLAAALLACKRITNQFGGPCWCSTGAGLYCVDQPQCRQARSALAAAGVPDRRAAS